MAATPVTTRKPLISLKWLWPVAPWFSIGVAAAKHPAYWLPLEGRILHVVGCAAFSATLLAIIQPWRRDDERNA
jgi:hypothetical protein